MQYLSLHILPHEIEMMVSKPLRSLTFPSVTLVARSLPSLLIERVQLEVVEPAGGGGFAPLSNVPEDLVALR